MRIDMRKTIVLAAISAGLLVALAPSIADAATPKRHHRQVAHRVAQPQQQIACTVIGCVPVPPGCGQTPGKTWSGSPTGGDVIVCPPGVAPFK
jgi:hypothetical protein